ncbi:MAG: Polysaccharide biosynthesis protein [Parcubacteria group bacterium GW2011_GWF2_45_11]|nr:MAG: Polysaccharide biosynthesis protein [Parcubacteria group bacterium GW2011_GWF2_45_11]OGW69910.1 MAG: UDP-N-acetylglucosamine 4,6-dehydratase (inverting) [Omnitrophica bacterium GWA2_50_21]
MKPSVNWQDKIVLLTGGTGSFGHEFVGTMLAKYKPRKLIIFSRDEMKQYEMQKQFRAPNLRYFIGDIRDRERLHRAFYGVNIIVHAAALKIVPTAEYNPFEAVKTNVIGAENIINVAIDNGVEKVIALSTDKAVNPINLYGATKLCAEKMFIAANNYSPDGTKFSVVRYGNVFGSRGSVVPFFKECCKSGVVPITDERMTRFWITLKQGVQFVMEGFDLMKGGEIFIPKIPSIKIVDLAEAICPGAKRKITGIRPGEKLHEALVSRDEGLYTYEFSDKFISCPEIVATRRTRSGGVPLDSEFPGYASDTNTHWLTVEDLKKLVEENQCDKVPVR